VVRAGESGSGKSTLALAILRMIKPPGRRLADLDEDGIRPLRLAGIALAPQGSMNSLNPVLRIGRQIADAFADHGLRFGATKKSAALRRWLPAHHGCLPYCCARPLSHRAVPRRCLCAIPGLSEIAPR
jgi:ABC-type dipeptide/oligopeptide/nickel transport system ATPase component